MRTDQQSVCAGKVHYESRAAAQDSITRRRVQGKVPGRYNAYACPFCSLACGGSVWHVGHISTRDLRARKRKRQRGTEAA